MLYHNQITVESNVDQLGVDLCNAAEEISEQGEYDYSLFALAERVGGAVVGDSISRGGAAIEMDGGVWKEMGGQYSLRRQWWPIKK